MFIKYISIKYSIKYLSNINQISRFNFILLLVYSKVNSGQEHKTHFKDNSINSYPKPYTPCICTTLALSTPCNTFQLQGI